MNAQQAAHPPLNVHERAVITWIAIFPLVALGLVFLVPLMGTLPMVLKALFLTIIIVPLAVYLVVPNLIKLYVKIRGAAKK